MARKFEADEPKRAKDIKDREDKARADAERANAEREKGGKGGKK